MIKGKIIRILKSKLFVVLDPSFVHGKENQNRYVILQCSVVSEFSSIDTISIQYYDFEFFFQTCEQA